MELTPLRPLEAEKEPERLLQDLGCMISRKRYFAIVHPEGAEPSDREFRLLIRDDAFGPGVLQTDLGSEWPLDMCLGADLFDPVDVLVLTDDGFLLMLRDGLMRIEKIPGIGRPYLNPDDSGSAGAMTIDNGKLYVAASEGRIFRREGDSDWRLLCEAGTPHLASCVVVDQDGAIVLGGNTDYTGRLLILQPDRSFRVDAPSDALISECSVDADGNLWFSGWHGLLLKGRAATGFTRQPAPNDSLNHIGHFGSRTFLAGPGDALWGEDGGQFRLLEPSARFFGIRGFERGPMGLVAQGENGFAIYDGTQWEFIDVPW